MPHTIAPFIEHTSLNADCSLSTVKQCCDEAQEHHFGAVCIPPLFVRDARRMLGEQSAVRLATAIGFPLGYSCIAAKSEEIRRAVEEGADDVDAVINIAAIKSGNWNYVRNDCDSMARAAALRGKTIKLIVECSLLTAEEVRDVCTLAVEYGIDYISATSGLPGFATTAAQVQQLRGLLPQKVRIKASGEYKTVAEIQKLLHAGTDRIGMHMPISLLQ